MSLCSDVQGTFVYYENLDLLLFRGGTNAKMHDYIKTRLDGSGIYNHWEFVTVDKAQYLINIKKYDSFYGGVWLPVTQLSQQLMVGGKLPGNVYMMDWKNENTSDQPTVHEALKNLDFKSDGSMEKIQVENRLYYNYTVKTPSENVVFGVMIPKGFFFERIPPTVKAILILLLLCTVLVPMLIAWLRRKIALPIQVIDRAMKAVGEGDMDYRIDEKIPAYPNELERLMEGFNHMLNEINQLEMNLYRTKIREQQIKLKYISQMIQPHFVLNALNIVYTYRENEFPLVKKMVRYLMEYFRYIVYLKTDFVTLSQEMRHIENYLNIQKGAVFGILDFFVEWESEASDCMIPPLIIQSFAENCLKYGRREDDMVFVYVLANIQDGSLADDCRQR